jgi:hypothetical protein
MTIGSLRLLANVALHPAIKPAKTTIVWSMFQRGRQATPLIE